MSTNVIPGTRDCTLQTLYDYTQEYEELCKIELILKLMKADHELLKNALLSFAVNLRNISLFCVPMMLLKLTFFLDRVLETTMI